MSTHRNGSLDLFKFLMAFMVVAQHTNFLDEYNDALSYLTVNGIFRIAVPIFLLISGFYFSKINNTQALIKFIKRLILMYVFWSLAYLPFWYDFQGDFIHQIKRLISVLVLGFWHLWYMPGLVLASLALYFLRRANSKLIAANIISLYIIGVFIQYSGNYNIFDGNRLGHYFNEYWAHRNFLFFCFPFMALGFLIDRHKVIINKLRVNWGAVAIGTISILVIESYLNYISESRIGGFDNYVTLIFVCPSIFIWVKGVNLNTTIDYQTYSSGVYFIHMYLIFIFSNSFTPTLLTVVSFLSSILLVLLIKRYVINYKYII